jgi:hypothetical protein
VPGAPERLALQTGRLDDERRHLTPGDELWSVAHRCFVARDHDGGASAEDLHTLKEWWPATVTPALEALAVTVALAAPLAPRERILQALAEEIAADRLTRCDIESVPVVVGPPPAPRPRFPYVYDPDAEPRAPLVAVLDGPCSPEVGRLLDTIKRQDPLLADAIVLGADLDALASLERLDAEARAAARSQLAAKVEQDMERWRLRAAHARARQRLESAHHGWHSDNFPPGCVEAFQAELRKDVEAQLAHPPAEPD